MDSSSEEVSTPKRAPRKRVSSEAPRAPRRTVAKTATTKRAVRKTIPRQEEVVENVPSSVSRKAPTLIGENQVARQRRKKQTIVVGVFMFLGIVTSAVVGYSDKGQIDVQKTIEDRNERIRTNNPNERDVMTSTLEIPVQNTNNANKADGGFVGLGAVAEPPKPATDVASTTATSSHQTASTTEVVASSTESVSEDESTAEEVPDESSEETTTDL